MSLLLIRAVILTLATGLVGIYTPSQPYHYVGNGLPLPFLMQVIDVEAAKYIEVKIDLLFLLIDILFWTGFFLFLKLFRIVLNRIFSSQVKQDISGH